jgi:hypothetical protein
MNDGKVVKTALNKLRIEFNGRNGRSGSAKTEISISAKRLSFKND